MDHELNNIEYEDAKIINNQITFYWLDNQIVTCKWNNTVPPDFESDEIYLINIEALSIQNERKKKD
jgi:hypothetical protein